MAQILNVERRHYINQIVDRYSKNKVGQYSKFLDKAPVFVTDYHINDALSREDVGTGNIECELGSRSPIRFNKITNFPMYNIPELKPDITYDESGYDIELDCNDIVILPNTIKPRVGDYFLLSFPGIKEYLFRVNNFRYNTIQSDAFYLVDADIKVIGTNLEENQMTGQIVETYLTVFENIGTQDRCFLKSNDAEYLNNLADLYYKLRDYYRNAFYVRDLNCFTYQTGRWSETGRPIYRYDMYLESFINKSHIYYDENSEESLILTPADVVESNFNFTFDMTLYHAILERNMELLRPYCYITTDVITMRYSIFNVMQYFGESVHLFCYKNKISKNNTVSSINNSCGCSNISTNNESSGEVWYDLNPIPRCTPTWTLENGIEYFSSDFLKMLINGKIDTDDYFELIIFNYLHNKEMKIDRKEIINSLDVNEHCFYYLPLVIYIIGSMYKKYFVTEKEIDV